MNKLFSALLTIAVAISILSCAKSNIDRGNMQIASAVPESVNYRWSREQVWKALLHALSEKEIIKTISEDVGLVATEYGTVEDLELDLVSIALLGKTYKYSYTVTVQGISDNSTRLKVKVNLMTQQIGGLVGRETSDYKAENFLRRDLFERVCGYLSPGDDNNCGMKDYGRPSRSGSGNISPPTRSFTGDAQVLTVQKRLLELGYNPGKPDGLIGKKTRKALRQFQQDKNCSVTGKMDSETLAALEVGVAQEPIPEEPEPELQSAPAPPHQLSENSQPEEVQIEDGGDYYFLTLSPTVMKSEPSISGDNLTEIPANTVIEITGEVGQWFEIRYQQQTGYVYALLVEKRKGKAAVKNRKNTPEEKTAELQEEAKVPPGNKQHEERQEQVEDNLEAEQQPAQVVGTGFVTGPTQLLERASVVSGKITALTKGTKVEILAENKDFYEVRVDGQKGFVHMLFVQIE